jgi:hypothetical protein
MARKDVSVRLSATGGRQVKAELTGIGAAGATSFKRLGSEMDKANLRFAALARRARVVGAVIAGALTAATVGAVRSGLQAIDAQAKLAQSLGTTTESVQVLARAGELAGVSMSGIEQATKDLTRRLSQAASGTGPAAEALDRLGLSANDLIALPLDQRVGAINAAIEAFVPAAERAAVAGQLFGEEGSIAISRIDSATLRVATEDLKRFGVVVSEQDADQIERTNDAFSRLGLIGRGLSNQLAVALAPALEAAADGFARLSEVGGPLNQVFVAVINLVNLLIENFDRVLSTIGGVAVFLAGRFVSGFLLAAVGVRGLATALVVLRGALIRTGIGAIIVGVGELIFQFSRLVKGAGGFGEAMQLLGDVGREFGLRFSTEFDQIDAAASASMHAVVASVAGFAADSIQAVVGFGNATANTFEGAIDAIKVIWANLPAIIGNLVIEAANSTINGIESLLDSAGGAIDTFIGKINSALEAAGIETRLGSIGEITLGDIKNPFVEAAKDAGTAAEEAFRKAFEKNPFDGPTALLSSLRQTEEVARTLNLSERQRSNELAAEINNRPDFFKSDAVTALRAALVKAGEDGTGALDDAAAAAKRMQDALDAAAKAAEEADKAAKAAGKNAAKTPDGKAKPDLKEQTTALQDFAKQASDTAGQINGLLVGAFQSADNAFRSFLDGGKVSFKGFVTSLANDLLQLQFRSNVLGPLAGALSGSLGGGAGGGGLGSIFSGLSGGGAGGGSSGGFLSGLFGSAKGNVFSSGRPVAFKNGGIVEQPTLFPIPGGRTGIMAEAGTEAIMPLKRINGRLGVEATGGSAGGAVDVRVFVDQGGNWQAAVEAISGRVSARTAAAAAAQERRAFGDRMNTFNARGTT